MKMRFIFIPLIVVAVALLGSWLTSGGMDWYKTINLPNFTPPGFAIGVAWTIIFILAAFSALIFFEKALRSSRFWWTASVFILNGLLNIFWSFLFFNLHRLDAAIWEAGLLDASVIVLIILIWPVSRLASSLLIPYVAWTTFAMYLTYAVWNLNK